MDHKAILLVFAAHLASLCDAKGYRSYGSGTTKQIKGFGSLWSTVGMAGVVGGTSAWFIFRPNANHVVLRNPTRPVELERQSYWLDRHHYDLHNANKSDGRNLTDHGNSTINMPSVEVCVYAIPSREQTMMKDLPKANVSGAMVQPDGRLWINATHHVTEMIFECPLDEDGEGNGCCKMECCGDGFPTWLAILLGLLALAMIGAFFAWRINTECVAQRQRKEEAARRARDSPPDTASATDVELQPKRTVVQEYKHAATWDTRQYMKGVFH